MGNIRRQQLFWGLAASISLSATSVWALTPMRQLDLISTSDRLEIGMHTGSIVPADIISRSPDRIIIEVSDVDAKAPIQTRFSGLGNISHLTIQPVSDTRVRLILRGQQLGQPSVGFKPSQTEEAQTDIYSQSSVNDDRYENYESPRSAATFKPVVETAQALSPAAGLSQLAVKSSAVDTNTTAQLNSSPKPSKIFGTLPAGNSASKPVKPMFADLPPANGLNDDQRLQQLLNGDKAPEDSSAMPLPPAGKQSNTRQPDSLWGIWNDFKTHAGSILGWLFALVGGLSLVLLLTRAGKRTRGEEETWEEEKPVQPKSLGSLPDRGSVLGLNSLERQIAPATGHTEKPSSTRTIAGKLALRQYQTANKAVTPKPPAASPPAKSSAGVAKNRLTQDEVRRSANVKSNTAKAFEAPRLKRQEVTPLSQLTASAKKALRENNGVRASLEQIQSGKAPIPNNPEVLEFLKSVADLLDQEQANKLLQDVEARQKITKK